MVYLLQQLMLEWHELHVIQQLSKYSRKNICSKKSLFQIAIENQTSIMIFSFSRCSVCLIFSKDFAGCRYFPISHVVR